MLNNLIGQNLEPRGKNGRLQSSTTADCFVCVHGGTKTVVGGLGIKAEDTGESTLHTTDTGRTANNLNTDQIGSLQVGLIKSTLNGTLQTGKERSAHLLVLLSLESGTEVEIVHEAFEVDTGLLHAGGAEGFLGLLGSRHQLVHSLRTLHGLAAELALVFGLELPSDPVGNEQIELPAAEVLIKVRRLDGELSRLKGADRNGIGGAAHIDEHDVRGLVLGKLLANVLEDAIGKGGGSILVHEALDTFDAGNLATNEEGTLLCVGVVPRNGNDPILGEQRVVHIVQRHGLGLVIKSTGTVLRLLGGDGAQMLHHHTGHGLDGDDHSLVIGSDLNANGVDPTAGMLDRNALEVDALHLLLGTRIVKRETNQALHECNGILVVGVGARRGRLTHRTRIRESNHASVRT